MGGRGARSGTGTAVVLFAAALAGTAACNHAWDALEPATGATSASGTGSGGHPGGTGGAASTTGTGGGTTASTTGTGGGATSSSSSGTGGSAPIHCGGTNLLSSDFSAAQPDVFWNDPQATVGGGQGMVTLPSSMSGLEADFTTMRLYDLTGDHVSLEVTQVPSQSIGTYASIVLSYDSGDDVFLGVHQGQLGCGFDHNGNQSVPMASTYDATKHRYWQLRESQGTICCETSPDGSTWSAAGSFDVVQSLLAPPTGVRLVITASTPGGMAPGVFQFDNLNGGQAPTGVWCPALSYTDSFAATEPVPGPAWDRDFTSDSSDSYDQMGGTLNFHFGADSSSSVGYESSVAYDMTGQRVSLQAIKLPTLAQGSVFLGVSNDDNTDVYWQMQSDGFSCQYDANGMNPTIWQGQAPMLPAWVGLRESNGAIYCDIYEGGAWKSMGSIGGTMDAKRVDVTIGTFEDDGTTPGSYTASVDNYNLAPP